MYRPARLLSVCRESGILFTRNQVLQQAGYTVVAAVEIQDALAAMERERFDLVIIGHLYETAEKNLIATEARRAGFKVLCMHSGLNPPDVDAATAFIHNLERPERLLATIAALVERAASAPVPDNRASNGP